MKNVVQCHYHPSLLWQCIKRASTNILHTMLIIMSMHCARDDIPTVKSVALVFRQREEKNCAEFLSVALEALEYRCQKR